MQNVASAVEKESNSISKAHVVTRLNVPLSAAVVNYLDNTVRNTVDLVFPDMAFSFVRSKKPNASTVFSKVNSTVIMKKLSNPPKTQVKFCYSFSKPAWTILFTD